MYPIAIGLRYMLRKRVTIIGVAGVAVGVMALTVVLSVMNGFLRDIKAHIRGTLTDLVVTSKYGAPFAYEEPKAAIERIPHVVAAAPFVEGMAIAKFSGVKQPVQFRGVVPRLQKLVSEWDGQPGHKHNRLMPGRTIDTVLDDFEEGKPAIFAGQEMFRVVAKGTADDPQADPEDHFLPLRTPVVLGTVKSTLLSTSVRPFRLAGTFKTGMYEFDRSCVYISLKEAQTLLGLGSAATGISVRLDDYANVAQVRQAIREHLGSAFKTGTWEEERATFIRAVEVERRVMGIILFFILMVAGFAIFAILTMVVMEKTKDIGTLRAIGATRLGIMGVFTFLGVAIGGVGSATGLAVGLVILKTMNRLEDLIYQEFQWRVFPQDVYYLDHIPHQISVLGVGLFVCGALVTSFLASLYPAWRAANVDPVESLRYE